MRISRPGHNVLDPDIEPKNVAFDSRWTQAGRIHMADKLTANGTVNFGKTFDTPPMVYMVSSYPANLGGGYLPTPQNTSTVKVFKDRVVFTIDAARLPLTFVVVER